MGDMVNIRITSTISDFSYEKRYSKSIVVDDLKGKLELITGVVSSWMKLELYDDNGKLISSLDDDKMLGYYSPQDSWRIHVIDTNPTSKKGEYDDLSKVEKYEISNEEYDNKQDSVRSFMKKNKMGKYSEKAIENEEKAKLQEEKEEELAKSYKVGNRCETNVPKQTTRRGTIMFIGKVEFQPGYWIGVKYDEPLGKNDGSVKGVRYFTCDPKYGGFVRPSHVTIGDFPEEDLGLSDEDEI